MDNAVAHALVRFGLGRRGGEPLPADPGAWARAQLSGPDPLRLANPPTTAAGLAALREDRENRPAPAQSRGRAVFRQDAAAQLGNALTTPSPFRERLVWFWTNHFTVSLRRGECAALVGAFVEEAIRPHVTGRFVDMLLAVMRHPAMLLYLDNVASAGPNSPAGQRGKRRAEREPGAGMPRTAHGQPGCRIHPGGRDELRARADRLVDRPAGRSARLPLPPHHARAWRADRHGPALSAGRGRRRGRAALSGGPSRDASLPGRQAGPAFRRRRSAGRRGAPHCRRAARHRRRSGCGGRHTHHAGGGVAAADQAPHAARPPDRHAAGARGAAAAAGCALSDRCPRRALASRSGPPRNRTAGRTVRRTGRAPRRCSAASTGPMPSPAGSAGPTRPRWRRRASVRWCSPPRSRPCMVRARGATR